MSIAIRFCCCVLAFTLAACASGDESVQPYEATSPEGRGEPGPVAAPPHVEGEGGQEQGSASPEEPPRVPQGGEGERSRPVPGAQAGDSARRQGEPLPSAGLRDPSVLALLNSPEMKRRFAESYRAESDLEPRLSPEEQVLLGEIYALITANDLDAAEARLKEVIARPGSSAQFEFTLGNVYFQKDDFEAAARSFRAAVVRHPKYLRAWSNLAQIAFRAGEFREAAEAFGKVISLGGGDGLTYGFLGVSHQRNGDQVSAESAFRMASLLDPKRVEWRRGLAQSFLEQERFKDAAAAFGALIKEDPERSDYWLGQGIAYARMGDDERAAQNLQMVASLGGGNFDLLNNLGNMYIRQKQHERAVNAYIGALQSDPEGSPQVAVVAAQYLAAGGAFEPMSRLIAAIRQTRSDALSVDQQKTLSRMMSRRAIAMGDLEADESALLEVIRIDPADGQALILLGRNYARRARAVDPEEQAEEFGRLKQQAIFYYERAAGIEEFEAAARRSHGELLVQERKFREAIPLLERSYSLAPDEGLKNYLEKVKAAAANR